VDSRSVAGGTLAHASEPRAGQRACSITKAVGSKLRATARAHLRRRH